MKGRSVFENEFFEFCDVSFSYEKMSLGLSLRNVWRWRSMLDRGEGREMVTAVSVCVY